MNMENGFIYVVLIICEIVINFVMHYIIFHIHGQLFVSWKLQLIFTNKKKLLWAFLESTVPLAAFWDSLVLLRHWKFPKLSFNEPLFRLFLIRCVIIRDGSIPRFQPIPILESSCQPIPIPKTWNFQNNSLQI